MRRFEAFTSWAMDDAPDWVGVIVICTFCALVLAALTVFVILLAEFPVPTFFGVVLLALYLLNHIWAMFLRAEARKDVKGQDDD